jgi:hypothetical protein
MIMTQYISNNIESARNLYRTFGSQLTQDQEISCKLERLRQLIQKTQEEFLSAGIFTECKKCGENAQHCCRAGTENKCDVILLLINLLLGSTLHYKPIHPTVCGFLGRTGCTLKAKHAICLNYICENIQNKIDRKSLIAAQEVLGRELDLQFILCERIKQKIEASEYY